MINYIATVHKEKDSDYGVQFYDFLGCITAGETIEEATIMAKEALEGHVKMMIEDGDQIPDPIPLEKILNDPDHQDATAYLVINLSSQLIQSQLELVG